MLSQVSNSSKRLGKLKKYKSKVKQSGFQFLLKSLERDKENLVPNQSLNMTHSVRIDPLLTAPAQQMLINQCHTDTFANPSSFYIENVKLLDRSDVTLSDIHNSNPSKRSPKHRNSKRQSSKSRHNKNGVKNLDSNKSKDSQIAKRQQIIYKTKQYLTITDQIISSTDALKWKHAKKAKNIAKQLVAMITTLESSETDDRSRMNLSIKTKSFNIYNSQILKQSKEPQSYTRIINNLEQQKQKLNSLISQHQMANIKLYIKMNEGESDQIQQCKKQLSMLFDKYKQLQNLIKMDKKRIAEILSEKEKLSKQCQQLKRQNSQLMKLTQKYQYALEKKGKSKKWEHQKSRRQFDFREESFSRIEENRQNSVRSELRIESLQNSLNSSRFEDEHGMGSSITTSTSQINKKGGRLGINLSCLDNPSQAYLQALAQEPQKLKRTLQQCRYTINKLESVINQQNKQLQISIKALEDFKIRAEKSEETVTILQNRLNAQKDYAKKTAKENRNFLNESESRVKKSKKQGDSSEIIKNNINIGCRKTQHDEYRIIALQASALEQAIIHAKRK